MYAEPRAKYGTKTDCYIYAAFNTHWETHTFQLPIMEEGKKWHICADTNELKKFNGKGKLATNQTDVCVAPRSMVLLIAK